MVRLHRHPSCSASAGCVNTTDSTTASAAALQMDPTRPLHMEERYQMPGRANTEGVLRAGACSGGSEFENEPPATGLGWGQRPAVETDTAFPGRSIGAGGSTVVEGVRRARGQGYVCANFNVHGPSASDVKACTLGYARHGGCSTAVLVDELSLQCGEGMPLRYCWKSASFGEEWQSKTVGDQWPSDSRDRGAQLTGGSRSGNSLPLFARSAGNSILSSSSKNGSIAACY
ncbi:unnamed protein product [Phytophthora lilii]|uniref:Unnamed protein product n=1 Tax=Phytophthora lilii TaxID=2077276 RepID=A0A9W6X294_9STRA|nr:unnamed protein product [Phytophthora lilii]